MSAGLDVDVFDGLPGDLTGKCSVVSIYEDLGSRDLLLQLCDCLSRKFEDDLEFKFDWWRFNYLSDPEIAMDAAHGAARADLILLSAISPELPPAVRKWFEGWLPKRKAAGGALVLVQSSPKGGSQALPLRSYLRTLAERANLDYLRLKWPGSTVNETGPGNSPSRSKAESMELSGYDDRPMHWGINE